MSESLTVTITVVPTGADLDPGPAIVVGPSDLQDATAELYRRNAVSGDCPAWVPIAAIVSTGVLNSPDRVQATGARTGVDGFEMNLEIRRFDGPMAANDPWVGLVRMDLGSLVPGEYRLTVRETTAWFTDLRNPEVGTEPTTSKRTHRFMCTGQEGPP